LTPKPDPAQHYDLIIIGGGPGGYVAADRAASGGLRVLLVEKGPLGGLCLHAGCIPSKALLASAKLFNSLSTGAKFGVHAEGVTFRLGEAQARKGRIINSLREGIAYQMTRRGVTVIQGEAAFLDRNTVQIDGVAYTAARFIIATGARHRRPTVPGIDLPHVHTLSGALALEALPRHLVILGADPLALGIGTIFMLLGVAVAFVAESEALLPDLESDLVNMLRLEMRKAAFRLGHSVDQIDAQRVTIRQGTHVHTLEADCVLYSAGRAPVVDGFGLREIGLDIGPLPRQIAGGSAASPGIDCILVNDRMQTNLPGVYAIGDVTGLSMWAHSASRMGEVAVNTILGTTDRFRAETMPGIVYTAPEIAWVGLTEADAKRHGHAVRSVRLPMNANGRFLAETEDKRGLCKLILDAQTGQILGAHLMAPNASDLLASLSALVSAEFRAADLKTIPLIHPTMSEIFKDVLYE
jgi:dihydrolipoamide dehydrogenase